MNHGLEREGRAKETGLVFKDVKSAPTPSTASRKILLTFSRPNIIQRVYEKKLFGDN
jgi:hypothetical protein